MNKLIFTAILSGFAGLYAMGQNEIRLMDMDLNKSYQTYGGAVKGKSVTNEPASIQGKTYDDVIGVQAKSHIKEFYIFRIINTIMHAFNLVISP